ncbi:MAG: cytochrome c oxidase assembly protein [Methylococcales bacterium]
MNDAVKQKNKRVVVALLLALGMMGVGVALIPLYDLFTEASGINGKLAIATGTQALNYKADESRFVDLDFLTSVAKDTPLKFKTISNRLQVHPGQVVVVQYTAQNTSDKTITGRANPSVAPGESAVDFKLIECFCLDKQTFAAYEVKLLQLRFVIDPKLPVQIKNIALALQYFKTK